MLIGPPSAGGGGCASDDGGATDEATGRRRGAQRAVCGGGRVRAASALLAGRVGGCVAVHGVDGRLDSLCLDPADDVEGPLRHNTEFSDQKFASLLISRQFQCSVEDYHFASSGDLCRSPELAKRESSLVTEPLAVRATQSSNWQAIIPSRSVPGLGNRYSQPYPDPSPESNPETSFVTFQLACLK